MIIVTLGISLMVIKSKISYIGDTLIILSAGIPVLFYIPDISSDLYNCFQEMNFVYYCKNIRSLLYTYGKVPSLFHHKFNFIYNIFQWAISKTTVYTILPFLTILIVYVAISFPFIHQRLKYNVSFLYTISCILIAFSLFPYFAVSNTIRWNLASGLFFLITYIYCNVSNKYNKWILFLYIPILFIHEAMFLPILVVLLSALLKKIRWYEYITFIFLVAIIFIVMQSSKQGFGGSVLNTAVSYINGTVTLSGALSRFALRVQFLVTFISPYLYLIGSIFLIETNKSVNFNLEVKLLLMFTIIDIIFLPSLIISQRYALYIGIISLYIYAKVIRSNGYMSLIGNCFYIFSSFLTILITTGLIPYFMNFNFSNILHYCEI